MAQAVQWVEDKGADHVREVQIYGQAAFQMERMHQGQGDWALYRVEAGVRSAQLDSDQYSNDLMERIKLGMYSRIKSVQMTWHILPTGNRPDWSVAFDGESRRRRISAVRAAELVCSGDLFPSADAVKWLIGQGLLAKAVA